MIVTVTINPAIDKTIEINNFQVNHVNRVENSRKEPGGKGINVSKTIKALGKESKIFSVIAGSTGDYIRRKLSQMGLNAEYIMVNGETRTNIKITDYSQNLFTDINESGPTLNDEVSNQIIEKVLSMIGAGDVLVLSGSLPNGIREDLYPQLIRKANERDVQTILDASGDILEQGLEAMPTMIKPNIHELESIAGYKLDNDSKIVDFARGLIHKQSVKKGVLISNGEKGSLWVTIDKVVKAEPIKTNVVSTVGAGDAMVGALAIGLSEKMDDELLLKYATATAVHRISTEDLETACIENVNRIMRDVVLNILE
ncbi:MAG: 1-phosphofructokinase [Clostridia bacterium]|nr:1-phosphofructokinase [Clostridia bacterium]